ncbi:MAG: stage III sporulation protein AB [Firmicutes bacterium]|nr:stage III sporulation protein AB [Bacillota bacterium]
MYFKLLGASLIVFAAYTYGYNISSMYQKRVLQLKELLLALEMLLAEVNYGLTPLPRAFINVGKKLKKPVGTVFSEAATLMLKSKGLSAQECWKKALERNCDALQLSRNGMELVDRLGLVWGQCDKSGQLKQIALIQELLRQALEEAENEYHKNDKIWKYLGLLGGLTMVIFLL